MRRKITAAILFFTIFAGIFPVFADEKDEKKIDRTPVPYTKEEFPLWQHELRRFEILSFGALPFVTLLTFWGYDMIRAAKHPKDPAYYPWPLKQADKAVPLTEKEQIKVFCTAVGISIGIALIDFTYRAIKRSIDRKKLERENLIHGEEIMLVPLTAPPEGAPEKPAEQMEENTPQDSEKHAE